MTALATNSTSIAVPSGRGHCRPTEAAGTDSGDREKLLGKAFRQRGGLQGVACREIEESCAGVIHEQKSLVGIDKIGCGESDAKLR